MAFALFYFFEENAIEVGKQEWIIEFDEYIYKNNPSKNRNVYEVRWPAGGLKPGGKGELLKKNPKWQSCPAYVVAIGKTKLYLSISQPTKPSYTTNVKLGLWV